MSGLFKKNLISEMFFSAAVTMIFNQLISVVATIIDGIITSRYLGDVAYSSVSLFGPFSGFIFMIVIFFSTGCQVVCSRLIGKGEKDTANHVFSISVITVLCFSILVILIFAFHSDFLISLYGKTSDKNPDIYLNLKDYIHGYMIGIPAVMLTQLLGPMCVMDGAKKRFILSVVTLCAVDVAGDLFNVFVFHGGVFGMGVATAVSFMIQCLILLLHLFERKGFLRFSVHPVSVSVLRDFIKNGLPIFIQFMATVVRDFLINKINIMLAVSAVAIAAKGVQNDMNLLMFCVGIGVGKALLTMTGIYYGSNDKGGLKKLFSAAMRYTFMISVVVCIVFFAGAGLIAGFYSGDPEAVSLEIFAIRCVAVSILFDAVLIAFQNYLQGIQNTGLVFFMNFADRLFVPVITAVVLGTLFGTRGIMASIATAKLILALLMLVIISVRLKRFPRSEEDFMLLPGDFGISDENTRENRILSMEDVMNESIESEHFCTEHGIDERKAKWISLFIEEIGGNIIRHGKPVKGKTILAEYRLFTDGSKIGLCFRDFCESFDPVTYYKEHKEDDEKKLGLKIVMSRAKDVVYYNTYNTNNVMFYLEMEDDHNGRDS